MIVDIVLIVGHTHLKFHVNIFDVFLNINDKVIAGLSLVGDLGEVVSQMWSHFSLFLAEGEVILHSLYRGKTERVKNSSKIDQNPAKLLLFLKA